MDCNLNRLMNTLLNRKRGNFSCETIFFRDTLREVKNDNLNIYENLKLESLIFIECWKLSIFGFLIVFQIKVFNWGSLNLIFSGGSEIK